MGWFHWLMTVCAMLSAGVEAAPKLQIVPGASLTAINTGEHVQAHGAGFIKVGNLYYMIGEDKSHGSNFQNVNCYSSPDLVDWTYAGALLSVQESGDLGRGRVVERPKVLFNRSTGKYVLFMHIDSGNYAEAKVGVAVGDSVCGKYRYVTSWRPFGNQSRDMGVFQDDNGTAYLLSEDRTAGLRIYRLAPDYLTAASLVYTWKEKIEAPAMLKRNGLYYMFGSHLSGWNPNDNVYSTAHSIAGPWSEWKNFAPKGSKTFNSQTAYVLPISNTVAIYMGDRWIEKNLSRSTYIWLPLDISGSEVSMRNFEAWDISVNQGTWEPSPQEPSYSAKSAVLKNGAKLLPNDSVGYIGGTQNGSVVFNDVSSRQNQRKTLKIFYRNGDQKPRYALLAINNGKPQKLAFLSTEGGLGLAAETVELREGKNMVEIHGIRDLWGPDIASLKIAS